MSDELLQLVEDVVRASSMDSLLRQADSLKRAVFEEFAHVSGNDAYAQLAALKISNLAVSKCQSDRGDLHLAARPISLMIDPSNSCQLKCPGCVHTANPRVRAWIDWPGGLLSQERFASFLESYGAYAMGLVLYNFGEPLLNRHLPSMIATAKSLLLHTEVSSNLSLAFDVESLVLSGLDCLKVSIDGVENATYQRFRQGGRLELVIENLRRVVAAKRKLGRTRPFLQWQFLTFEHNLHEVRAAIDLAAELGIDEIWVATPFRVDWDDPGIRVARSELEGHHSTGFERGSTACEELRLFPGPLEPWATRAVQLAFERSWLSLLSGGDLCQETSGRGQRHCEWLYQSLTLDALGRIMPCCMPPQAGHHRVYGMFPRDGDDPWNGPDMVNARAVRRASVKDGRFVPPVSGRPIPYCAECTESPQLTYSAREGAARDLSLLDRFGRLGETSVRTLTAR